MQKKLNISGEICARAEPLRTIKQASEELGLPYFKLNGAAKLGLVPTYTFLNGRRLVRVSEVSGIITASRVGGRP